MTLRFRNAAFEFACRYNYTRAYLRARKKLNGASALIKLAHPLRIIGCFFQVPFRIPSRLISSRPFSVPRFIELN